MRCRYGRAVRRGTAAPSCCATNVPSVTTRRCAAISPMDGEVAVHSVEPAKRHRHVVVGLLIVVIRRRRGEVYVSASCRRIVVAFTLASALLVPVISAGAQTPADNTKVNKRDRAQGRGHGRPAEGKHQRSGNHPENPARPRGRQDALDLRAQREGRRSGRTGHAQGAGPDGGREEDRRGQGHRSGGRRTCHQSTQHRPGQGLEKNRRPRRIT